MPTIKELSEQPGFEWGKTKISRNIWDIDEYFLPFFINKPIMADVYAHGLTENGVNLNFKFDGEDNWQIYVEPKKKRVMYKALIKSTNFNTYYTDSDIYYEDLQQAIAGQVRENYKVIKLLEHTRIEVEDE